MDNLSFYFFNFQIYCNAVHINFRDSGSIMVFSIGGVMTAVLLMLCLIVYCVQRSYAKKREQRVQSGIRKHTQVFLDNTFVLLAKYSLMFVIIYYLILVWSHPLFTLIMSLFSVVIKQSMYFVEFNKEQNI